MVPPYNILISGYFGFKNTGDELILDAMIRDFRAIQPEMMITVVSGNPDSTKRHFHVNAVSWADIRKIICAVEVCDLVILGGGGLFHDYWGFDSSTILTSSHIGFSFYSSIAMLAAVMKKPLMLYAVGVGPILSKNGLSTMKAIAGQASTITIRDDESRDILLSMGIPAERILLTADPVFNRPQVIEEIVHPYQKAEDGLLVGVALRNWDVGVDPAYWEKQVAEGLDDFLERHPAGEVLFIPFQNVKETLLDDPGVAGRVQRMMKHHRQTSIYRSSASISNLTGTLSTCDLVMGMRLHSLILAMNYGVPAVALSYDRKIANLMTRAGLEAYSLPILDLKAKPLSALLEKAWKNQKKVHSQMLKTTEQLRTAAAMNVQAAMNLIEEKSPPRQITRNMQDMFTRTALDLVNQFDVEKIRTSKLEVLISDLEFRAAKNQSIENEQKETITRLSENIDNLNLKIQDMQAENQAKEIELLTQIERLNQKENQLRNDLEEQEKKQLQLAEELVQINEKNRKLLRINRDLSHEIETRKRESDQLLFRIDENERSISGLTTELESIKNSRGWKMLWGLWQVRTALIPHGSKREEAARSVVHGLRKVRQTPLKSAVQRLFSGLRLRMSRYAYPFRVYKKRRDRTWNVDLSSLNLSQESGLVSVVLPVYNGGRYLKEAVDSVLCQSYKNFELIIVDDGSTDNSGRIMDEFAVADKRVRVVHQGNQKLPRTLNNGFDLAHGEFLTWTSDDNRMKPQFLMKMVTCLQKHPTWDMIFANMDIIGEDGTPLKNSEWYAGYQRPFGSEHIHLPADTSELNTWPNNSIGGAFLYRSRVKALLSGYSQNQFTREDYDYWMQVNSLFNLKHVDFREPVYEYRFHSTSLTHKDEELNITRNRKYLMAFDDFRRDFYLMPLLWVLEDGSPSPRGEEVRNEIRRLLEEKNQVLLKRRDVSMMNLPHLFLPAVYLKVSDDPAECCTPPENMNGRMIKVLLCTSNRPLPAAVKTRWDICLSLCSSEKPVKSDNRSDGWWYCSDIETLLKAVDIKVRAMHLHQIENETRPVTDGKTKISVILCTYQRNQVLEQALRAIAKQTLPQDDYEVVVVDNSPKSSEIHPLIEHFRKEEFREFPDHLRLVHCPIVGLSFARNAGIAEAKSDILLFLDDDAVACPDVLEHYWKAFSEHSDAGIIGGHIILKKPNDLKMVWKEGWERYWSQFKTGYKEYTAVINWWEFPWGANWCARRKALMQIGGFRGKYGRRGNDFSGGEEIIAASLVQKLGYSIGILPQAQVLHQVDPARFTLMHLRKTINAGIQVNYQEQLDLYLPNESNLRTSMSQSRETIGKLVRLVTHPQDPESQANRLEISYFLQARARLMRRQTADSFRRIRFLFPLFRF